MHRVVLNGCFYIIYGRLERSVASRIGDPAGRLGKYHCWAFRRPAPRPSARSAWVMTVIAPTGDLSASGAAVYFKCPRDSSSTIRMPRPALHRPRGLHIFDEVRCFGACRVTPPRIHIAYLRKS